MFSTLPEGHKYDFRFVPLFFMLLLAVFGVTSFLLSGCATGTGGPSDPFLSAIVPSTLYDDAVILSDNATTNCNGGASRQYNAGMNICVQPGVMAYVSQIPGNPFVTPAQAAG